MNFDNLEDLFTTQKKDEYNISVKQRKNMWIVEDNKGRTAIGSTLEDAKENYVELFNKEYNELKERVDRDLEESRRKHRALWNY